MVGGGGLSSPAVFASVVTLCASVASSQLVVPSVTDTQTCAWNALIIQIRAVDAVCCFDSDGGQGACADVPCTVACAEQLIPLLTDCRPALDVLFDGNDGVKDGVASQFDTVYTSCLSIEASAALGALATLHRLHPASSGPCSDAELNGVGETEVGEAPCVDVRDSCAAMIAFMSCDADFAPGGPLAGQCDLTCNLCSSAGGGHRLQTATPCDLSIFQAEAARVDAACCDDGGSCADGVPATCDAKCAVAFAPFYDRCSSILATQIDPTNFMAYGRLYDTCSTGLPVEPLLGALAACGAAPTPPPPPPSGWFIGFQGESCTHVCVGFGYMCADGDWGVHDSYPMTSAMASAGSALPEAAVPSCRHGVTRVSSGMAPYISGARGSSSTQCVAAGSWDSRCDASDPYIYRLCLCI